MGKRRIKAPTREQGRRIQAPEPADHDGKPPIFSLERVQEGGYSFTKLDREDKAQFAEAIFRRRLLTWRKIKSVHRHGLGAEKIARNSIKTALPAFIKEDTDYFLAFRFSGKKPMVGYRIDNVFYVLWFDNDFTLYDH
uniref:Uncharacterized protein n=1 Tax=Candidatus Kentrum sp. FW TaxID=2126338 RepID=A0A450SNU9_9GAMM|nr:MAG: hypothetical protein BECKFW1821B_GA0114236_102329 [Candidatus Kentron sp. FW]